MKTFAVLAKKRLHFPSLSKQISISLIIFAFAVSAVQAQTKDSMPMMSMHGMNMQEMTSAFSPNLTMNRDGSGTSWQPDASGMMMYTKMNGQNQYMFHGFIFLRYTNQDIDNEGERGADRFDAPNMFMFMFAHHFNDKNLFSFISMISLEPFTVGQGGYPLLFQTGESYKGEPLVDKQHPHDLFSELAINYTHAFTKDFEANIYFGYPGEPALGPVVFMHRLSALNDPDAPLGHHWQDATHITFGVGTVGIRYKIVKMEGSIFTGREPDENRYNFDQPKFDSYSYRISVNPNQHFAVQFSQGFIKSPEALFPSENIIRTTASVIHVANLGEKKFIASTLVWGMNHSNEGSNLHSILAESNLKLIPLSVYGRYEFVQKDAEELNLTEFENNPVFNINAITLGVNKIILSKFNTDLSIGLQGTINFPSAELQSIYGRNPIGAEIYLKIAPKLMSSANMH